MPLRAQSEEFLDKYYGENLSRGTAVNGISCEMLSTNGRRYLKTSSSSRLFNVNNKCELILSNASNCHNVTSRFVHSPL